jgi:putative nucleotidyltransferase with HDIG domain
VITAVLSEMLAESYPDQQTQAFTAGLLHDLGRAILDQYFPEEWRVICQEVEQRRQHWLPVERELIGTDHGEIGYWMAERWSFPPGLSECMRFHHEPLRAEASPRLTGIVHLADILSRRDNQEQAQCEAFPQLDQGVYRHVPLSKEKVEALAGNYQKRKAGVEALIGQLTTV